MKEGDLLIFQILDFRLKIEKTLEIAAEPPSPLMGEGWDGGESVIRFPLHPDSPQGGGSCMVFSKG